MIIFKKEKFSFNFFIKLISDGRYQPSLSLSLAIIITSEVVFSPKRDSKVLILTRAKVEYIKFCRCFSSISLISDVFFGRWIFFLSSINFHFSVKNLGVVVY